MSCFQMVGTADLENVGFRMIPVFECPVFGSPLYLNGLFRFVNYHIFVFYCRWVVGIWLVMKCSADDLLDRLRKRGTRDRNFTRALVRSL